MTIDKINVEDAGMQYSPKLKRVIKEIEQILECEDIAANVILHTPGHSEYLYKVNASYSAAKHENGTIRIRAKLADFNGDKAAWQAKIRDTVNMFTHFADLGGMLLKNTDMLIEMLKKYVEIEYTKGGDTSHTTQNN